MLTTPLGVIMRTTQSNSSVTYAVPPPSTVIRAGDRNEAAVPTPSRLTQRPAIPAQVLTTPAGVILRIVQLPPSTTYSSPPLPTATPRGARNRAAPRTPSSLPNIPARPASVLTTPSGVVVRMV